MALGDPISGGVNVHATLFFGLGKQGWTENYFINVSGGTDPLIAAENSARRIVQKRKLILPADISMEALRLSKVTTRGDSNLIFPPAIDLGGGNNLIQSANPALGWLLHVENDDFQVHDSRIHRGWIPADVPYTGSQVIGQPAPPVVVAWATNMSAILTAPYVTAGATTRFCIRSFNRPSFLFPAAKLKQFAVSGSGRIQFVVIDSAAASTWSIGDTIKITVPRKRCVKGINGRARITDIVSGTGTTLVVTVDRKLCCGDTELAGITGEAYKVEQAFYPINYCNLGRQAKRDVGRAFFATRGRQAARCC